MEIDTITGGDELSIDEAAAAYAKATTSEVPADQPEVEENDESETTDDELQEGDEPESEEDDGETGDEDQAEDEDDEEPETERGRYVAHNGRVKLADGTEATVADLIAGNLKGADYTRKTQEVAEQRRSVEAQSTEAQASKKQAEEQRQFMTTLLQQIVPPAPDPSLLDDRSPNFDPMRYQRAKAENEQWTAYLDRLTQDQQRAAQERQAEAQRKERERADSEWDALIAKVPEFKDDKRLNRFVSDMKEHAEHYGLKPEELRQVALDHRQALVLKDAIAWRKLQAKKPDVAKKVEGRPPVQKGGKRLNSSERNARTANDAMTRLKQSGSERDAVAAYLASQKG